MFFSLKIVYKLYRKTRVHSLNTKLARMLNISEDNISIVIVDQSKNWRVSLYVVHASLQSLDMTSTLPLKVEGQTGCAVDTSKAKAVV